MGAQTPATASAPRVLVADDNHVNQLVASEYLRRWGHAVTVVSNGQEALDRLDGEAFDVVLLDLSMPVLDGFQTVAAIRERELETSRRMPVVALTAHAGISVRERCLAAGFDAFVSKPFNPEDLRAVVVEARADRVSPVETVYDRAVALRNCGADDSLLGEMQRLFAEGADGCLREAAHALKADDLAGVAFQAHKLQGAAACLGAEGVIARCRELERLAKAKARDALPSALEALRVASVAFETAAATS